ncbi:MAG: hypothetical protein IH948_08340 [Bacteroidetes bacterium]|nr:hypothetical protein [Bacteroidota bacterium]
MYNRYYMLLAMGVLTAVTAYLALKSSSAQDKLILPVLSYENEFRRFNPESGSSPIDLPLIY